MEQTKMDKPEWTKAATTEDLRALEERLRKVEEALAALQAKWENSGRSVP